ncbi:MAG TPA: EAL domain-containing protein [Steroidobacteraceae bacterium]|jgi:Amt family ammonium transporter
MSLANAIQELLLTTHQHVPSAAVAYTSVSRDVFHLFCGPGQAGNAARDTIARTADSFLVECRSRREPLIKNRVREVPGGPLICRFIAIPIRDDEGDLLGIMLIYRHATDEEFSEQDARRGGRMARVLAKRITLPSDGLTGLLTRTAFQHEFEGIRRAQSDDAPAVLLYADIDQLHVINDLWGFETGDRAISAVAEQLHAELALHGAILSRLSGDRFTAFIPNCTLPGARRIADKARESISATRLQAHTSSIALSVSVGVAVVEADESRFDHAVAAAEVACKAAKDRGRNRVELYQMADQSIIRRRDDILVVGQLRSALEEGRFQIFGQPICPLLTQDDLRRYEMLVRIVEEDGKLVMPAHFMSSATRYQLLPQLDRCVIGHVLHKLSNAAREPGFVPLHASLNLSGPTIGDPDFLPWLLDQLAETKVPGDWLTFELTETATVANIDQAQQLMRQLGDRGCKFALDDFGTGLSSLAQLKTLNFSTLKIDGSFVRDVLENKRSEALVRAVAQLANAMDMETVAEYVETPQICMRLIDLQVQFGQGFALGHPLRLDRILNPFSKLSQAG